MSNRYFTIYGMDCAEEVAILKREVGPLVDGEHNLSFDILNARMGVAANTPISDEELIRAVARTGMRAEVWREERQAGTDKAGFWSRYGRLPLTIASGVFLVIGFAVHALVAGSIGAAFGSEGLGLGHSVPLPAQASYFVSIICGAWYVLPKAWFSARSLRPDMNLLMIIAVAGAIGIGEWFEAATVAFLFAVALTLESWSIGRARKAVAALLDLASPTVLIRDSNGKDKDVPIEQIAVGTVFLARPGERIGLDGEVKSGISHVNQAPITGESIPIEKASGDIVYAGTINGDGLLEVRSTKPSSGTALANIIRLVSEAQSRRAPSEQWVEKFARVYTPVVMGVALLVLIVPPVAFAQPWSDWLYRSLVLLVIGCPCALVISTPISIVAGLTASARNGVLIKGGLHLEAPAHLKALALDKTGTLTLGKPVVVEVVPLGEHDERELIQRAAALEVNSDHPIAKAIVSHASNQGVSFTPADKFAIIKGKGATGVIDGREFWLGSHRYLEDRKQETPEVHERLETLSRAGQSIVVIGNDQHVCGFIAVADSVRPAARNIVEQLHSAGIKHVIMLTGDNKGTAEAIAKQTGVDDFKAELLPQDKVTTVEELLREYGTVGMVGDGVNDAPALARATLGIAMGAIGSDAAIETADVALMSDDLSKVAWLIHHSRRTLRIIRQNIVFSLAVKAVFVLLTFLGIASLWSAIAADMGASLLVVFNGLRLLRMK